MDHHQAPENFSYFRYLSLPTLEKAQTAIKWNFVISNCLMLMAGWLGMVMYSVYRDCDPISVKQVTCVIRNQDPN